MTLRELLQALNKIAEENDLDNEVYIENWDGAYTSIDGVKVGDDGDINIY